MYLMHGFKEAPQQPVRVTHGAQAQLCCLQGGNDHEIFESSETQGHTVTSPMDTQQQCTEIFIKPMKETVADVPAS